MIWLVVHLVAVAVLAGVGWVVQLVVYPYYCGGYYYYCYPSYWPIAVLPASAATFRHSDLDPYTFYTYVVVARK